MLPAIRAQLQFAFRNLRPEERTEAMADAMANAAVVYARLYQLGKVDVAYPSALARFAAAQYRSGRRVGASLNVNDVTSCHAQRRHSLRIERLDRQDAESGWKEILVEDRGCTPAELAASLEQQPRRRGATRISQGHHRVGPRTHAFLHSSRRHL